MDPRTVATLDRLADAAWVSQEEELLGPWKLRAGPGATRRANSVLPTLGLPGRPAGTDATHLPRLIELAEAFYAQRGLPSCFYVSPAAYPANLDQLLAQRGYRALHRAQVWTAMAEQVQLSVHPSGMTALLEDRPGDDWIDCAFDDPSAKAIIRRQLVDRIAGRRVFASVRLDGQLVATALGVGHEAWTGLFCMSTRPAWRRMGCARALLHAVGAWSLARGHRHLYLQVRDDNSAAIGLYGNSGFYLAYACHYRVNSSGA